MRYVLVLLGLMFANVAQAIDCEKVPTCEELGYSTEDDPNCADNGYMYCPFNHEYKKCVNMDCAKWGFTESDKSSWCGKIVKCKGNENYTACACAVPQPEPCVVGSVYYANGICTSVENYQGCGTPVGVVYYATDDGKHGKVINLKDLGRKAKDKPFDPANPYASSYSFCWGYDGIDIEDLVNLRANMLQLLQDKDPNLYDGKGNTDKIFAVEKPECKYETNTEKYYQYCIPQAAQAARDFYPPEVDPDNPVVGKGHWYLPSLGELMDLYGYNNVYINYYTGNSGAKGDNKKIINQTLNGLSRKKVSVDTFLSGFFFSSTEYGAYESWFLNIKDGWRYFYSKDRCEEGYGFSTTLRVSLEF